MMKKFKHKNIQQFWQQQQRRLHHFLNRFGSVFDSFFSDNRFLVGFSFLLAVGMFVSINFSWLFNDTTNQGELIANIPVVQIYDKENYVVEGLPAFANLTLFGDTTDIEIVKSLKQYQIEIDLSELGPGNHSVEPRVKNIETGVTTSVDPQQVQVTITPKVTKQANLSYELINEAKLNQDYLVRNVKISQDTVVMKGSQANIDRVAIVQALVDIANLELGSFSGKAQLVAFDDRGNKLDVSMEPRTVDVSAEVVEYSRIIPLDPVFSGLLPDQQAVKSYRFSKTAVLVYGPRNVLNTLTSIRVPINYANVTAGEEQTIEIPLPAGVKSLDPSTVQFSLEYGALTTSTIPNVAINAQNLGTTYQINTDKQTQISADVKVSGTSELIKALNANQLTLSVNLQGLGVGTHEVPIQIDGPTYLSYQIEPETITIVIEEK